MNRPFFLYHAPTQPHGRAEPLVNLTLTSAQVQFRDGVQLRFDVSPYSDVAFHCLWLDGAVSDRNTTRRYYGRLEIEVHERPSSATVGSLTWLWRLLPEEIEALEAARTAGDGPLNLWLHLAGAAIVADVPVPIIGDQQLELSLSEWQRIQVDLGYEVPTSQERLLTPTNLQSPGWRYAAEHLAKARGRLAAGDGYDAMQDALSEFESLASGPYKSEVWKSMLTELPEQKADGIAHLLAGYCTYLNKVGHHRARRGRATDGRLPPMPMDQWEAELAVAIAHFLLAYARRIQGDPARAASD